MRVELDKTWEYMIPGALIGLASGFLYGVYDGLSSTDNGTFEALHNMLSRRPNIFSKEYWIITRDFIGGGVSGGVAGGLAGLVGDTYTTVSDKLRRNKDDKR